MTNRPSLEMPPGLLRSLAALRWFAVGGQIVTVALVTWVLGIALDPAPLWAGIAALAAFNAWATWRARAQARPAAVEVAAHAFVDIAALAWMIGWSGGAMNPFAPLFLLPIALVAVALPPRWVVATAAFGCVGYAASAHFGRPLPPLHGVLVDAFNLHLAGMAVMFAISVAVIVFFVTRLAEALRRRERELARLREQFARNEGILALATHAAAVAHELNTPLGTLTLMLEDRLDQTPRGDDAREELETMAALVDVCRDRVRALAAPAEQAAGSVAEALDGIVERWRLVRPAVVLERSGTVEDLPGDALEPAVGHLLLALLNNAADAGERAGDPRVALHVETAGGELRGSVRDHGPGFASAEAHLPGTLFRSTRAGGLGVGLALSHATVERLGGTLSMQPAADGGVIVAFRLPLRTEASR
jgi:two-component system sensor histidine kinase RegB